MDQATRYAIPVASISQDEIDLLECLLKIDQRDGLDPRAEALCNRLVEAGLVDRTDRGPRLTSAGIERCQSLQHHMACDREAAKVLAARGMAHACGNGGNGG